MISKVANLLVIFDCDVNNMMPDNGTLAIAIVDYVYKRPARMQTMKILYTHP